MIMPMLAISADESPPTKASGEEESGVNGGVNNHSSSSLSSHASSSSSSNPRAQISPSAIDDADDDDDAVSSSSSMQSLLSHSDETPPPPPPQPQRPQSPIVTSRASYKKRRRHTPEDSIIGSGSNSFTTNSSSTTTITTRSNQLAINGNNSASPSSSSSSATATSSNKLTNPSNATVSSTLTRNIDDESNVKVAVRIRPQLTREKIEMCKICTNVTPGEPQVSLGHKEDKSFTFDYVFDQESAQEEVYSKCVEELVDACFEGYNATVLAYGQTGSGKTYTMGTSFDTVVTQPSLMSTSSLSRHRPSDDEGLIPRAIAHLFDRIESRSSTGDLSSYSSSSLSPAAPKFTVLVQFMELYNEEINDLFAALPSTTTTTTNLFAASTLTAGFTAQDASGAFQTTEQFVFKSTTVRSNRIEIHEDHAGGINVQGCSTHEVRTADETLEKLRLGARIRTTGATNMNLTSSRSHAIFTIHLKQTRAIRSTAMVTSSSDEQQNGDSSVSGYCSLSNDETGNGGNQEFETLNAKFHFVDLAGSERLKRTGATGHRAKEGISINRGLLALGNVISALGDKDKRGSHVPYRDSKLTRLLQDSLGGNSKTLMIACISPSDRDFMETLNTLRYANRARNIKNKVHVNQDKTSKQIAQLKAEIERLSYELMQYKSRYHYHHHHPGTPTSGGTVKAFVFPKSDTANSISSSRTTSTVTIVSSAAGNASTNLLAASSFAESRRSSTEFLTILNDLKQENSLLLKENQSMRLRIRAMQETIETVRGRNADLECRNHGLAHRMTKLRSRIAFAKDRFTAESSEINEFFDSLADETNNDTYNNDENNEKIYDYLKEIEDLRSKLNESESMCKHLQQAYHRASNSTSQMMMMKNNHYHQDSTSTNQLNDSRSSSLLVLRGQQQQTELGNSTNELLEEAKNDVETDLSRLRSLQSKLNEIATVDCSSSTADDNDECDVVLTNITDSDINGSETNKQQPNDPNKSGSSNNKQQLETSLDELQSKIDIKRRLINELEINTRSLEVMRVHYEEKMSLLHERIKQMEDERDRVIFNMTKLNQDNKYDDQIRKIKVEYEVKLRTLQTDLAKYEQIKTKNAQMLKNALETEKQLEQLRKEIVDMKKLKVKLMNQLKDETHKSKMEEQRRQREIAALKRDHLRKDNQIRSLEAEKRCREIVLKRKQEEIQALRKHNNGRVMSEKASGRTTSASNPTTTLTGMISEEMAVATSTTSRFINGQSRATMSKSANDSHHHPPPPAPASSYMTKRKAAYMQKWQKFDDTISAIIVKKQTISLIEREMERFLEQREKIGRKLNRLMKKLEKAMSSEAAAAAALEAAQKESSNSLLTAATTTSSTNSDINNKSSSSTCFEPSSSNNTASNCSNAAVAVSPGSKVDELREQIDIMKSNIDYLQDQIAECQTNIIQLDEAKDGCDYMNLESLIQTICSIEEAKFVLKKLLIVALNKGIAAAQKEHLSNELECELEQIEKDYYVQQQVVQQMINSGQISNEFVQQILLYNQPCKPMAQANNNSLSTSSGTNGGAGGDSDQPRMMPMCNPVMMNGCSSDNFEIDEIILAPMIEDSTSESEDEDEEMTKLVESGDDAATSHLKSYENVINPLTPVSATFRGIKPPSIMQTMNSQVNPTAITTATTTTINQFNSSSSTSTTSSSNNSGGVQVATASIMVGGGDNHSTSSSSSVSYKARQVTTNGPQDFLYISTMAATVTNQVNTVNDSTTSPQQQQLTSPPSNLVQTSRICSKSYTKIPEVVANSSGSSGSSGSNSKAYVPPTIPPVPLTTSNRASLSKQQLNMTSGGINTDLLMMNGMSMSRSVIVTAADAAANNSAAKAGYNRMTMSSISRQNSKDSVISISPPDSPCYGGGGHHHSGTVGHQKRSTHHSVSSGRDGSRDYHYDTSDSNVFKRLTAGDVHKKQAPAPEHGLIKPYSGNTNRFKTAPVTLTHVAEGHSKAVLALDSYDGALLFTGSKDRTAKVWDLATGAEIASLSAGHTNHVTRVRFCPVTRLCFTVSSYYVNVWDLRVPTANKCIKTLCSSGLANDGEAIVSQVKPNSRILHNEIPFGEKIINDLVADKNGHDLYVAAGETVKIWDLKQFQPVGNLSTGHSASISTLLVDDNMIITGSKDHYIKIFEANKMNGSLQYHHQSQQFSSNMTSSSSLVLNSKHNLTPPHYDGVQSLCLVDSQLFSCSRDMCIKKWSLIDFQCKQSINNCHKDWIRSLDYMRNYNNTDLLISGCRGGYLKFWNINTLEKLADFKAHLCPINSIKVSNNLVFTASDDATVRIWKRN